MSNLKIKLLFILFLLIVFISSMSCASYETVQMSVVEEPVCTINFETNSYVERKIISKDLDNKEITFQISVTNNESALKPTGELILVVDNSKSMLDTVSGDTTREDLVINSSKTLINNLLEDNDNLKIGIVSFSTNSDISKEGTIEDAQLISTLSNDSESLISAVSNIEYTGPRTDLSAGIRLAKEQFSGDVDNAHKYVIVLTDGVPNVAIDYDNNYFSDDVISKTKSELESLSSVADNVIVMLTGISNGDSVASPSTKTYNQIIEEIFGTTDNPTIGDFYYITDDRIEDTITNTIYNSLLPVSRPIINIKVTDTFSQEIVDNFDFSYVQEPNYGTISDNIITPDNCIIWDIPELNFGETAIVQYKLKLKEDFDESIIDKVLDTNPKLDLSYTNYENETNTLSSDVTPSVKLTEPTVETPTEELPKEYPKAGRTLFFGSIAVVLVLAIVFGFKYYSINK